MRKLSTILVIATIAAINFGCKTEKKVTRYENLYSEKPAVIYIAPIIDKIERKKVVYADDLVFNREVNTAHAYMYQTLQNPVIRKGYYVIGPMAAKEIARADTSSVEDLKFSHNLMKYSAQYGIDAILFVTINRWVEENGEWIVFLNYTLKSTKTAKTLMNYYVKAHKMVILDSRRDPQMSVADWDFADEMGTDNGTTQRARILECVSEYVLKNLPAGSKHKKFEQDIYNIANPECFDYLIDEENIINFATMELEEYEKECFDL